MAKKQIYQPTEAELEILKAVWELEPASVRAIFERISAGKNVGYTTVLKQVQRLTEKGVLEKEVTDGSHLYRSTLRESDVKQHLVDKILHTAFDGSALQMMMHALGNDKTTQEELLALKKWLDQQIPDKS
ncbi:MAG: BlaI/MecI/CopY family transcriptional regulator [Lewinellaceae bacterium]|nr:BlaI/MecI/CopY family transcriptional regulator [Saprospiraceae bacterium]MCB9308367.1 BlaI/MecI/CopY family transcriptional regulator [Lewinellaceae bacterium]MCB9353573.1 BlaI/MecI/CopY family transcriptional regulator [Lewinellaceae bacterium]